MNIDELRDQLEQLAGPVPRATSTARAAVADRVRRAHRRRTLTAGGTSALAAAVVVTLVAVGLGGSKGSVAVRTTTPSTTTVASDPQCALGVATVPASRVPSAVATWAHGEPVVGGDELWTERRSIASGGLHDGSIWRLKISWYTTPFGIPTITARRLDGPGAATGDANEATDARGRWVTSTIELPSAGCWEITAMYRGSTITFRRLIGNPPRPLAIGTITGTLEEAGFRTVPIAGTVTIATVPGSDVPGCPRPELLVGCEATVQVTTDSHGRFRVDMPEETYSVTGHSPLYLDGAGECRGGDDVRVDAAQTTNVAVVCPIR